MQSKCSSQLSLTFITVCSPAEFFKDPSRKSWLDICCWSLWWRQKYKNKVTEKSEENVVFGPASMMIVRLETSSALCFNGRLKGQMWCLSYNFSSVLEHFELKVCWTVKHECSWLLVSFCKRTSSHKHRHGVQLGELWLVDETFQFQPSIKTLISRSEGFSQSWCSCHIWFLCSSLSLLV